MSILELLAFSWLIGTVATSLLVFWLGFIISGRPLRWVVTAIAICGGVAGLLRQRKGIITGLQLKGVVDRLLAECISIQLIAVTWIGIRLALGYDGLVLWELKAALLFGNGGVMPTGYFADVGANYPHPHYPLFLPLVEAWIYEWLGRRDQGLLKLLFPMFYLTAVGLLMTISVRLTDRLRPGLIAAALLFFIPTIMIRVSSGEVDFPLGVFYLAATGCVLEYYLTGQPVTLRLAGITGSALVWVKQEGLALWICLVVVAGLKALSSGHKRRVLWLVLPGLAVVVPWLIFLQSSHARITPDYLPVSLRTLVANLNRGPAIVSALVTELANWRSWSLLWVLPLLLLIRLRPRQPARLQAAALLVMLIVPLACFGLAYFFSAWTPFTSHIEASLPRILAQVAPATLLVIVLFGPTGPSILESAPESA
jgi:hypothetical protein